MSREYLRVFKSFEIDEVKKGLLIVGDLSSDCAACQELGLDSTSVTTCPECGITFKYVTSRRLESNPNERFQFARKMADKRPDLTIIDYSDYKKILGKKQARDFFG